MQAFKVLKLLKKVLSAFGYVYVYVYVYVYLYVNICKYFTILHTLDMCISNIM